MLNPGIYRNKRGETINLIKCETYMRRDTDINRTRVYTDNGKCLMWHYGLERYVMDTDPKSDLDLAKNRCKHTIILPCLYCGAPVPLDRPTVACDKPDCQDKESAAWEGMD